MDFVHLHVHSHYSLLNGLTKVKQLVKAAKERGFKALALTDYGAMYGAIEFYEACLAAEIKPIIGFEAFVAPRSRLGKDEKLDKETTSLVLLAENFEGYKNLLKLSSFGQVEGLFYGKPRIDKELLKQHSAGIIGLSGSIDGEVPALLKIGKYEAAKQVALIYQSIFTQNNYYLELQDHPAIPGQIDVNTKLVQLSKEIGIPVVVTRDVHYLEAEEAEAQDILRCIAEGAKVNQIDREDFRQVDRSLNTSEDIASRFRHIPEALENTFLIAERVKLEIPLNKWHFAPVQIETGKTAATMLRQLVMSQVEKFYSPLTEEVKQRLQYELEIIEKKGYAPYFLCVADYVRYAKSNGIVETTRGSAAGSLVSYVIGITTVDPILFQLPFERFLNPYRPSPPDIDTDFADDRRDEMISYVTKKYGEEKVAQIITFGTMAARASVRDVGRALGYSYTFCDQVAKLIPHGAQGFPMTIERALKEEPDLRKLYTSNQQVKRLLDLAQKVEGCARHTSIHAAGVVIAPTALTDFTPIQRETGGEKITTQYDMYAVESAGLLKMDFLGIRNLSILGKAVEFVLKTTGEKIDIYSLPLDDALTFALLSRGETMGVFQLGGSGMTRWLKELKPSTINDIMAMVALYRPGPMDAIPEYIRRKHNEALVSYLDPRMKEYLQASFGLLVYQDDVLLTAIHLAGYDWLEAEKFRKAIGKKIPEEMEKQKIKFFQGCRGQGKLSENTIKELWRQIEPFAAYGFNKSHAASYGIIAFQTAYMKAHYPVQYMTAVLQAEADDSEKVAEIVHECHRMGIEVLPPDVNESFGNFAMVSKQGESGRIRFGLTAIKNVGEHICEVIYQERKEQGEYKNLEDFLQRIQDKDLNKKSLESLIQAGAMDSFGHDRGLLLYNIEYLLSYYRELKERAISKQHSLFDSLGFSLASPILLREAPPANMKQKLDWEKSLLGVYVSSHPCAEFQSFFELIMRPIADMSEYARDQWVVIMGVINTVKKKLTKKGGVMLVVSIEDQSGSIEVLVFPKVFEQTSALWIEGAVVCLLGKTPSESGDVKIFAEKVHVLTKENVADVARYLRGNAQPQPQRLEIHLRVTEEELKVHAETLKVLFMKFPGEYAVYVHVGQKVIRANATICWNEEINNAIDRVIGKDKIVLKGAQD